MRDVDAISICGIAYAAIVMIITAIFFKEQIAWPALGAATALFNHSMMIKITKNGFNKQSLTLHLGFRFVMYTIVIAFLYFDVKALGTNALIESYIFLLLGLITVKMGVFIHYLPFVKKHTTSYKQEVEERLKRQAEEALKDVDEDR